MSSDENDAGQIVTAPGSFIFLWFDVNFQGFFNMHYGLRFSMHTKKEKKVFIAQVFHTMH
jgi:hypothetical protein